MLLQYLAFYEDINSEDSNDKKKLIKLFERYTIKRTGTIENSNIEFE